jgi:dipeptidyl aminopeptidase/acylaminoacyl peptidase
MPASVTEHAPTEIVQVVTDHVTLEGNLVIPAGARGIVVFAHGSGSSRLSPRNRWVAERLNAHRLATLLFDLLTPEEEELDMVDRHIRFDIPLLAERVIGATDWLAERPATRPLQVGYFGSSTGAAAALMAAGERTRRVGAVVSRGGRVDLAEAALEDVRAATLLVVGQLDYQVLELNRLALRRLSGNAELAIVPGATHLFAEPGTLEEVARLAGDWFSHHLGGSHSASDTA